MTTAIVTTDPNFGPWNIPARGQNMITNYHAKSEGIVVNTVIPEPVFSNLMSTTRWVNNNRGLKKIILCSIYQIPWNAAANEVEAFINDLEDVEFIFSIEGIRGHGRDFLLKIIEEVKLFSAHKNLDYNDYESYDDLYELMKKQ